MRRSTLNPSFDEKPMPDINPDPLDDRVAPMGYLQGYVFVVNVYQLIS
ncbi:MAG: hypothetical protein WCI90_01325 [Chlorobium sp.]